MCHDCSESGGWTYGLCNDLQNNSIDTIQLGNLFRGVKQNLRRDLDLLVIVACSMCNLEVGYQVRRYVKYMAASEKVEKGRSWPYWRILQKVRCSQHILPLELAKSIVEKVSKTRGPDAPVSQAALNLKKLHRVAESLGRLAKKIRENPAMRNVIRVARKKSLRNRNYRLCDIKSFCENLKRSRAKPAEPVRELAARACEALKQGDDRFVLRRWHRRDRDLGGVTVYFPVPSEKVLPCYGELAFAEKTGWKKMLDEIHKTA
jgi:hypothetical protein